MKKTLPKPREPMRLLINSNAQWSTSGYGQQMAEIVPLIKQEGYTLACIDFYGLQGGKLMLDGILHYPQMNHVYGSDAMVYHGRDFNADYVFSLQDIWVLNDMDLQQIKNWIPIVPIDCDPVPRIILEKLKYAKRIVTYSQFGHSQLEKQGLNSTYIPHTVDTEIFKPMDKKERKEKAGLQGDPFIVGMVAANKDNPPRKSFQEVMDAFSLFLKKVPNSFLYIHTNPDFPGGFPIKEYANFIGINQKVLFPDVYSMSFNVGKKEMALIYNTFDVLLIPSRSEGFGVPIIEAEACGVPVITNNFASMPELIVPGFTGHLVDSISKPFMQIGSYHSIPSTQGIYDSLIKVHKADREKMGVHARKFIVDNYDTRKVFEKYWRPFLQKLEKELTI